jgi:hypothetical protein
MQSAPAGAGDCNRLIPNRQAFDVRFAWAAVVN